MATTVEDAKPTIGAGNLIYEGVYSERWGEVFEISPLSLSLSLYIYIYIYIYIHITSFPHFQPNVLNLPYINSVARKKIFLCR